MARLKYCSKTKKTPPLLKTPSYLKQKVHFNPLYKLDLKDLLAAMVCLHSSKKIEMSQSNQLVPRAYLPVSKQVYPHFMKQPKMVTQEMLRHDETFSLGPFLPNEIFCQIVPTPKDSLEGGKKTTSEQKGTS